MGCFHEILSVTVGVCLHAVLALEQYKAPGRKNEYF